MKDAEQGKKYIVEVMFRDGAVQKWRTDERDTGRIAIHWENGFGYYAFKNDEGGYTRINSKHVVTIETYVDENNDTEIGRPTVGNLSVLHENEVILNKDQISFYC